MSKLIDHKELRRIFSESKNPDFREMCVYVGVLLSGWEYVKNVDSGMYERMVDYAKDNHGLDGISIKVDKKIEDI